MTINIIISISFLIILIAIILVVRNYQNNRNIFFIAGFLIIYAIQSVVISLINFGGPVWLLAILLNNFAPLYYLSPVLFYFAVRSGINDSIRFRKTDLLHLIPFVINLIAIIPYLKTDYSYKYSIAQQVMCNYYNYMSYDFKLFYPPFVNQIARPVIFLGYIIASLVVVIKAIPRYKQSSGIIREQFRFMMRTAYLAVAIFSFFTFANLFVYVEYFMNTDLNLIQNHSKLLLWFSSLSYLTIPVYILLNPEFMYDMPQIKLKELDMVTDKMPEPRDSNEANKSNSDKGSAKSEKSSIHTPRSDDEFFIMLTNRILEYLENEEPYLDLKFSVHKLCVELDIPRHHLQYCLNVILKKSFTDLKNELRVNYAMNYMKNNIHTNITIEGVGRQSGFASNSNFYAAFRTVTGCTPSQWINELYELTTKKETVC